MAIDSLELALKAFGAPIYVYHEIVHNQYVVRHFESRGVEFIDEIADAPVGLDPAVQRPRRLAGDPPSKAKSGDLRAIDATCPLVTKVHLEAIKYAKEGRTIVLIGHEGHDEVIGTMGEAPEAIVLVESPEDVDALEVADENHMAYLTQTTLSVDDTSRIIARLQASASPAIVGPAKSDICYATQNRQEAVSLLSGEADLTLVLGSQNSSNSQRLAELSKEKGIPAHLIDGPKDIQPSGSRASRRCSSPPARAPRRRPSKRCSTTSSEEPRRGGRAAAGARGERLVPAAPRAAAAGFVLRSCRIHRAETRRSEPDQSASGSGVSPVRILRRHAPSSSTTLVISIFKPVYERLEAAHHYPRDLKSRSVSYSCETVRYHRAYSRSACRTIA